jgi:iron-sulfur cluster insertion protein
MIKLTESAIARINEIKQDPKKQFLRITVDSGGCNGFQYNFNFDNQEASEDIIIARSNNQNIAITDKTSLQFLEDAEIDFIKEIGASYFKVNNPNATSKCGCGSSFAI